MKNIFWLLLLPTLVFSQTAEDIALKTEAKLRSLRSLQADFKQVYYSSTVSTPLEEEGRLYLQKPGWMKWEYRKPEKKIFLIKNNLYQEYYVEEKQLVEKTFSDEENEAEVLSLLAGERGILENYSVDLSPFPTENSNVFQIKLTPLTEEADTFILLEIDVKTWLIKKVVSFDWTSNKQEFHFSRIEINKNFPKDTFELDIPADVEIIK